MPRTAAYSLLKQDNDNVTEMCEPENLIMITRTTRRVFCEAIVKRVVNEQYGHKKMQHSHLAVMAMLMTPCVRSGKYLNVMRELDVG